MQIHILYYTNFIYDYFHFQLASDLVENWIKSNPEASICTSEGVNQFKAMANFQDYHGLPQFRQVSHNMKKIKQPKVWLYIDEITN